MKEGKEIDLFFVTLERDLKGGKRAFESVHHYCVIRSRSRLMSKKVFGKSKVPLFSCRTCCANFKFQEDLDKHVPCNSTTLDRYPEPGTILRFTNLKNTTKVPFTFVFHFESFLKPINESEGTAIEHIQEHVPSAFALHCISRVPEYQPEPIVRVKTKPEENMVTKFLDKLKEWVHEIYRRFKEKKPLSLTAKEEYSFQEQRECWICGKPFRYNGPWKEWKVRNHDHFTWEFRGAAHNKCNLRIQSRMIIPVIAHNLSKYDLKLIIHDLMKYTDGKPHVNVGKGIT